MTTVSFSWSTRREGNFAFIKEECSSGWSQTFKLPLNPNNPDLVQQFVNSRRRIVRMRIEREQLEALSDEQLNSFLDTINKREQ